MEENSNAIDTSALTENECEIDYDRPIKEWNKRDTVFAIITVISSIVFISLSLFGGFNIGFTVSFVLLFVLANLYIKKSNKKYTPFSLFCGGAAILLSAVFSVYNNGLMNFVLFLAVFSLFGVFLTVSFVDRENIILKTLYTAFDYPFKYMGEPFRAYSKYCKDNNKKGPNRQIITGIAISIPILAVVLPLLIKSDAAFEGLMSSLFSNFLETLLKIILGTALSLYIFSKLFAINSGIIKENETKMPERKTFSNVTAVTVLSVLSVFYAIYLLSQLAYFFSAFSGILPESYTFTVADYARRGFFELCGVCSINLCVLFFVLRFVKRNDVNKNFLSVRLSSTLICAFSVVFVSTAISKMVLYIKCFGLTELRLETSVFMLALGLIFLGAVIYVYQHKFPIVKYVIITLSAILLTVGFFDVDKTVAKYNVNTYLNGGLREIDVEHLGTLSDSALPYIEELLNVKDKAVREEAEMQIYYFAKRYYEITDSGFKEIQKPKWEAYNYSHENAKRIILKYKKQIIKTEKAMNNLDGGCSVIY